MIITCKNITKSFGVDLVLDQVNFQVNRGERVALVGRNGSGKSTLFKIIAGEIPMDSGDCILPKNTTIGYLSQNLDLDEDGVLWDEMVGIFDYLLGMEGELRRLEEEIAQLGKDQGEDGLDSLMKEYGHLQEKFHQQGGYSYPSRIRGVLKGLGFEEEDYQKKISQFSGGQRTRIALAKLLIREPDILLLDEPTNFLDLETTEWLENFLSNYPNTLLVISHDRYFLDALVHRVFELENHHLSIYRGNYTQYTAYKQQNLEVAFHQYKQQQREIQRQEEIIARFRSYNREKSIKKAESRQKMLDRMELLEAPTQLSSVKFSLQPQIKSGREVLEVEGLEKSFGDQPLFSDIHFQVYRGDHIGIIGPNGVGKTTLFNILLGKLDADEGKIRWGHHVHPAYYDQLQASLEKDNTILEEVWSAKPSASQTEIRNILGAFLFQGDDVYKAISDLSGGEKSRVSLAKLMLSQANLLLMDEPTNHLDMDTKEVLENALNAYTGTLLIISHDRYFLNRVAHKILRMDSQGMEQYLGNYDYYVEKRKQLQLMEEAQKIQPEVNKTRLKQERRKERENRQILREQENKVKTLENEIEDLERAIADYELIMCQPSFYEDSDTVLAITKEYESAKKKLKDTMHLWEENMLILEDMKKE